MKDKKTAADTAVIERMLFNSNFGRNKPMLLLRVCFNILFQAPVVVAHGDGVLGANATDMPCFGNVAGDIFLIFGIADDEAILPAMLVQPFLLGGARKRDIGNGDIKGKAGLVLAGTGSATVRRVTLLCLKYRAYTYSESGKEQETLQRYSFLPLFHASN